LIKPPTLKLCQALATTTFHHARLCCCFGDACCYALMLRRSRCWLDA
jgi:hypothetical protein